MSKLNNPNKSYGFSDALAPFGIGGISGSIATCLIQPIDTLKVQIQVTSEKLGKSKDKSIGLLRIFKEIKKENGFKVFYTGIDSAVLRQIFYGSARLGSYNFTLQYCKHHKIQVNKTEKVGLAIVSGAIGALIGSPFDVALVRKQASINSKDKISYKNTYDAFKRMIKEQGVLSLWTGIKITIFRVVLINVGQLASNEIISDEIQKFAPTLEKLYQDNLSATLASVLTSFISLPADNLKIKMQKQHKNNQIYNGILDCFIKTVKNQGFTRLWVGFWVYLARGFPHSFVLIRTQQYLSKKYEQSKNKRNQI